MIFLLLHLQGYLFGMRICANVSYRQTGGYLPGPRGTFDRAKVPKARRGVPNRPGTPNGSSSAGGLATRTFTVRYFCIGSPVPGGMPSTARGPQPPKQSVVRGLGHIESAPAAFGSFPPVERNILPSPVLRWRSAPHPLRPSHPRPDGRDVSPGPFRVLPGHRLGRLRREPRPGRFTPLLPLPVLQDGS